MNELGIIMINSYFWTLFSKIIKKEELIICPVFIRNGK